MSTFYDPSYQNARRPLIDAIDCEEVGIDVAMWFMEDNRYSAALIRAHQRGVTVRVLMNRRDGIPTQERPLLDMAEAGIPMRCSCNFFHAKAMIFAGQSLLVIGGANFSASAWNPEIPYVNYIDECIGFFREEWFVTPAMREFDDAWTNTAEFVPYGNACELKRHYPLCSGSGDFFLTEHHFIERLIDLIQMEQVGIDIIVYRATHLEVWHQLHLARERGVMVRMIMEPIAYFKWAEQHYPHPHNEIVGVYYLQALGGFIKMRAHEGLNHEKFGLFHSSQRFVFGSQNWNVYEGGRDWNVDVYNDPAAFEWAREHFMRKWRSPTEFKILETSEVIVP